MKQEDERLICVLSECSSLSQMSQFLPDSQRDELQRRHYTILYLEKRTQQLLGRLPSYSWLQLGPERFKSRRRGSSTAENKATSSNE